MSPFGKTTMLTINSLRRGIALTFVFLASASVALADDFNSFLKPLFEQNCVKCHGGEKTKGKVNLKEIGKTSDFLAKPALIKELIEVIDFGDMPPEDQDPLSAEQRDRTVLLLKDFMRQAVAGAKEEKPRLSRLNRFQYNNSLKDLFRIRTDVFELSEKMMTRHNNYLLSSDQNIPDLVRASAKNRDKGFREVMPFPKDLRASHGFDNQSDQLTLSPLLLDSFLKLSVSILQSPDFNEKSVGIWKEFFAEPENSENLEKEIRDRLHPFLHMAFRSPVDKETANRYVGYAHAQVKSEESFTTGMKKVASAILSSPLFLFRHEAVVKNDPYALASSLSYSLWGSCPDPELLKAAKDGKLSDPKDLALVVDRMLNDPKIERFLDSFPSQWMQLENALAATPDPKLNRYFSIDRDYPASLAMVLEPLLLFDAVFLENRPIAELIKPSFAYRNDFLETWYGAELKPGEEDLKKAIVVNENKKKKIIELEQEVEKREHELAALVDPVRKKILAERAVDHDILEPIDLRPVAAWEFGGDLKSSVGSFPLKKHGKVEFRDGMAVIGTNSYLQSQNLPFDLRAKSLEVWFLLKNLDQKGGGVMGIQGPGDFFDTIVLGERMARHWISGSNGFSRTDDFAGSKPEDSVNRMIHLIMTYQPNGMISLHRNGEVYGRPFKKPLATFPKGKSSVILGLRHTPKGGGKHLAVTIDQAILYDRALNEKEVEEAARGSQFFVSNKELLASLSPEHRKTKAQLEKKLKDSMNALRKAPKAIDPNKLKGEAQNQFDNEMRRRLRSENFKRVTLTDPRYGGIITNAAMLSMTSGPKRSHPIARGAWIIEVILNDPPPPPPNDIPPLQDDGNSKSMTIREQFAKHREHADCAGCHSKLDPLGFAMENFDLTGRWREKYPNGREVDSSGSLMRKHTYGGAIDFKDSLLKEKDRYARAFVGHLLRFFTSRKLAPGDTLEIERIAEKAKLHDYRMKSLIREVLLSPSFSALK
jgi:hypothetical protein